MPNAREIGESLRIARRELALALERQDADSAVMLERAIIELERTEHAASPHLELTLSGDNIPLQREPAGDAAESCEAG